MSLRSPVKKPLKHRALVAAMSAALALGVAQQAAAQAFPASINLGSLNGSDGFRIDGVAEGDGNGRSVSAAGDVNGDGFGDLIIGAYGADPNGDRSGSSYVVFGKNAPFAATLSPSSLNGANGFRLDGAAEGDYSGVSVGAAGDLNGDGIDDLIVGADGADPNGDGSGSGYVVLGQSTPFTATLTLGTLNGTNGFRLDGAATIDHSGMSVSAAGDVNGDGLDDLIVGAYGADPNGERSGSSYVVFGKNAPFAATLSLSSLSGVNGFRLDGAAQDDHSGRSVSAAGDVNGDGLGDLIVGADGADPPNEAGSSYVVFGRSTPFAATLSLGSLTGADGFRLDGADQGDFSGNSVSAAGDVNGDRIDDLIVGAYHADANGAASGSSYVVFGRNTRFAATISLASLNGATGFRLDGAPYSLSGFSVSNAGDINGDGKDDLIVGAPLANSTALRTGSSYVVFGQSAPFAATLALSSLNGATGFRLDGAEAYDRCGYSVSAAGDINGDGIDDLIVGANKVNANGSTSGSSYVVFGRDTLFKNGFE